MPNINSAKKRLKQNIVRRERNRSAKRAIKTECKKVVDAAKSGNVELAEAELRIAAKKLDQAAAKHTIHRNAAARVKSAPFGQGQSGQGQVAARKRHRNSRRRIAGIRWGGSCPAAPCRRTRDGSATAIPTIGSATAIPTATLHPCERSRPKGSVNCGSFSDSGLSSLNSRLGWMSVLCWYLSLWYSVNGPRMSW